MRSLRPLLIACALAGALLVPSQALALSPVITDCNTHNALTHHYSVSQLRHALATMPADVKEYTACYQIIDDQLFRQLGRRVPGSGSGSSGGGSFVSTPILIAVIVVILLGGGLAYAAWRRGEERGEPSDPDDPDSQSSGPGSPPAGPEE